MMRQRLFNLALFITLLPLWGQAMAAHALAPIRLGSVAMDTPRVMHKRLLPLTQYLSHELNRPVELVLAPNMPSAISDVANGNVELAYLTPVAYIRSRELGQTKLIAKTITEEKASLRLMIVVRQESPIRRIEDLAGKRFAFGDPSAQLQWSTLAAAGVRLESLSHYDFLDHHDNVVRAVLHRDYDAGIVRDTTAYAWQDKGLRILYSSAELPPFNITAAPQLDEKLRGQLRQAFLKLDIKRPEHQEVIRALDPRYTGFAATDDSDYDNARMLIKPFGETD